MAVSRKKRSDGKDDLTITCDYCGKPITQTNEYGMFCADLCGLEEAKAYDAKLDELVNIFDKEEVDMQRLSDFIHGSL